MTKRAIIVVDFQNEYLPTGKLPLAGLEQALTNAARLIDTARTGGDKLFHIRHEFAQPDAQVFVPGSDGVEIIPAVAPAEGEPVVLKHSPNAFRGTNLQQQLEEQGVEELVIIGAMSHMCVEGTSRAASDLGYAVTVVQDACATMDLEFQDTKVPAAQVHATAMAALAFAYATIASTEAYLAG
ncbi:cysteine hydrolase family protein [Halomonas garicola]|uniref:cysteine hydrolase family protein n=1 Tax=Halomonas garicola TaxID=1690008 RepID=UPI00289D1EC7|nr:cysteine hydrolase family protein [Halomonas garicola]